MPFEGRRDLGEARCSVLRSIGFGASGPGFKASFLFSGNLFKLFVPQFSYFQNGNNNNSTLYLRGPL